MKIDQQLVGLTLGVWKSDIGRVTKIFSDISDEELKQEICPGRKRPDIHFGKLRLQIVRAVVHGRLKLVKTEYSEDELPLDPDLAAILRDFIREAEREALAKLGGEGAGIIESDLLFVRPMTGRHFHASPIGQDYIRPAGCCSWIAPNCGAVAVSGANPTFPFRTGSAYRCTMGGGKLPGSMGA